MTKLHCFNWRECVLQDRNLSFGARAIAIYFSTFMNDKHDFCYPSVQRIAHEMKTGKRQVQRYIKELEENEWIIVNRLTKSSTTKGGIQRHNKYLINIPDSALKGVTEGIHLMTKGVTQEHKGGDTGDQKGVTQGIRNNNINNKRNNNAKNGHTTIFKNLKSNTDWLTFGDSIGVKSRPGESWDNFKDRVKNRMETKI